MTFELHDFLTTSELQEYAFHEMADLFTLGVLSLILWALFVLVNLREFFCKECLRALEPYCNDETNSDVEKGKELTSAV